MKNSPPTVEACIVIKISIPKIKLDAEGIYTQMNKLDTLMAICSKQLATPSPPASIQPKIQLYRHRRRH